VGLSAVRAISIKYRILNQDAAVSWAAENAIFAVTTVQVADYDVASFRVDAHAGSISMAHRDIGNFEAFDSDIRCAHDQSTLFLTRTPRDVSSIA
jgi:hypothetical protein